MEPSGFSREIIRILPKAALACKYNCSVQYVRKVLQAKGRYNSPRARSIRKDAIDISAILFGQAYNENKKIGSDSPDDTSHTGGWCVSVSRMADYEAVQPVIE